MRSLAIAFAALACSAASAQVSYPPPDLTPFVRTVQSIGPDGTGNVNGVATSAQLNTVMVAGDTIHVVTPSTGQTVIPNSGATLLFINNTTLLAALTVTMPSSPIDGQRFLVAARSGVTLLTFSGGTLYGTVAGLAVSGYARFVYSASAAAWFRTG